MPASEAFDFEREFEDVVRELRAVPSEAPPTLRERVRALGEPERRRSFRLPKISWRGAALVLVPACLLALVSAAAVHGLLSSSSSNREVAASRTTPRDQLLEHGSNSSRGAVRGAPVFAPNSTLELAPVIPTPSPVRHQDYQADLRIRVKDFDALGQKTAQAMRVTQQLGGYVSSVSQSSTSGQPGESDLVLRVPVAHVQDAMIRLSALGTVLEQHVSIVDLENVVQQQRRRIETLRLQIARLTAALEQAGLAPDVKLRLQFQLDDARRNLANVTGANKATLREAALSRISLSLTTQKPVAAKHHSGRFGNAASDALDFLAGAGAVALAALIILSPLLVIAALAYWGVRTYRRREAQRLLGTA